MVVILIVVWLLLNHSIGAGHIVLGTILGVLIPMFTRRFFPEPVYLRRGTGRSLSEGGAVLYVARLLDFACLSAAMAAAWAPASPTCASR